MGLQIAFWILAAMIIGSALAVVFLKNAFRTAIALVSCFIGVAGIYVTLSADFLAGAQVLVYVGGISVLILLVVLLTHNVTQGSPANKLRIPAFLLAAIFLGLMIFSVVNTSFPVSTSNPVEPTTQTLGNLLFSQEYILPILTAGMLLLAAILGAIVLVREK
jgi:NADH:ubiquinone oxidoreductase subunit 6 (subunit J)